MTAIAVVDELRDNVLPLPPDTTADDSASEPSSVLPGRLYVYPRRLVTQRIEDYAGATSGWDYAADLRLRALYTVGAKGEARVLKRSREISIELDNLVPQVAAALEANRLGHPLWWDIYLESVAWDATRSFDVRGIGFDVVARLNLPQPDTSSSGS
jgi:hypothetical protein